MAIDKNFVIKNGLEVNTNVLVAAADEKQVGIGTTRPYYKLHVGGGEGSRGGIGATDITISGIATLGVGNSSQGALNVVGISTFDGDIDLLGSAGVSTVRWDASENRLEFKDNASIGFGTGNDLTLWHDSSTSYIKDTVGDLRIAGDKITLELEDGTDVKVIDQFGVNITGVTTTNRLLVSGISTFTGNVDANGGITANTVIVEDLTNNRVVIAGSGGELESSAILTDNGSTLTVGGDIDAGSNTITAATFSGNASTADGVDTTATSTGTHFMVFADSSSSTTGETMRVHSHYYLTPSSSAGSSELMVRGDIIAFANASSDDKLKTNKIIIPDAIDKVKSLGGFTYEWNELGRKIVNDTDQRQLGVSAQEVQAVLPEAVKSKELEGEEILVVKYEKIVPLLIEAIKELADKVDNLEQKLSDK